MKATEISPSAPAQQAQAMRPLASDRARQGRQEEGKAETHGRVHAETDAAPLDAGGVERRSRVGRPPNTLRATATGK